MSVFVQDGSANSQAVWTEEALSGGMASGAIISPFCTPWLGRPQQPSADQFARRIVAAGGELIVDATSHATNLAGTSNWTNYNTWALWSGRRGDLSTRPAREQHVALVFDRQVQLGAPRLSPTLTLDNAVGAESDLALDLAQIGSSIDPTSWQSLAGRRGLWLSPDLDTLVGALVQLGAPTWVLTQVHESSDYPADSSEPAQTEAFLRTVDSLARRSRVIVTHADLAGLPAIAAGAEGIGAGWHSKHRVFSTGSFQAAVPGDIRRQAVWYTYEALLGRLHKNESDALIRTDLPRARALYTGDVDSGSRDIRLHHLGVLAKVASDLQGAPGRTRDAKVSDLRALYEAAIVDFDDLALTRGRAFTTQRVAHIDWLYEGLRAYATAEGIWAP